jgi:hypothetical protein
MMLLFTQLPKCSKLSSNFPICFWVWRIVFVIVLGMELDCIEWCIPCETMTSPERLDWMNPL